MPKTIPDPWAGLKPGPKDVAGAEAQASDKKSSDKDKEKSGELATVKEIRDPVRQLASRGFEDGTYLKKKSH